MYLVKIELQLKKDLHLKDTYEKTAKLIRLFIDQNNKVLKKEHYEKKFAYYSFSNFFPREEDHWYKKNEIYHIELRSLHEEFLDLKKYKGLESEYLIIKSVNAGRLYRQSEGTLYSETPVYFHTKKITTPSYQEYVFERIRENIVFRYVKSGRNKSDDLNELRKNVIKTIEIDPKIVSIPFPSKKLKNGNAYIYHCLNIKVTFQDNPLAKEVENVIYAGGLGRNTSNGFGFMS